jgi:predicted site-specific integrase-resolvase
MALVPLKDACALLEVSYEAVWRRVKKGEIKVESIGRVKAIDPESLKAQLAEIKYTTRSTKIPRKGQ